MIDGKVIFLCQTIQQIQAAISSWEHYPDQAQDLPFDAKQHAADLYPLQELLRHQDIYQDDDLHWRIVKLRNELKNNLLFPPPSLIREFQNLYDQLMCALGRHRFAYIPEAAVPYFENEKLFGESVYNKFPDLREDIKDAGNCFAAALYTACVFHLMRIAEYGMRRIAIRVGVSLRDNKKPLPVEYATWDKVIQGIKAKVEQTRKSPKGQAREHRQQLYSDIADQCMYFRDIWRDRTMHARKRYSEDEALRAMHRVREFMALLSH